MAPEEVRHDALRLPRAPCSLLGLLLLASAHIHLPLEVFPLPLSSRIVLDRHHLESLRSPVARHDVLPEDDVHPEEVRHVAFPEEARHA